MDLERLQVHFRDNTIEVTPNESRILALLMRNHGKVVSRIRFMRALWMMKALLMITPNGKC